MCVRNNLCPLVSFRFDDRGPSIHVTFGMREEGELHGIIKELRLGVRVVHNRYIGALEFRAPRLARRSQGARPNGPPLGIFVELFRNLTAQ